MNKRLMGKTVVVTRPAEQADEWLNTLSEYGVPWLHLPTLAIEPIVVDYPQKAYILDLDRYDYVVCVSVNAAKTGLAGLADYWPQWPVKQQWFAVGPATGAEMALWHLPSLKVAQQGDTSESLLQWQEFNNVTGKSVLILRGAGGRETLAETLRDRGANVDYIEWYQRSLPQTDLQPLISHWQKEDCVILTVTSGDGLRNLINLVGNDYHSALFNTPLVVISGRLDAFARQLGFQQVWCASSPAIDDVLITLEQINCP